MVHAHTHGHIRIDDDSDLENNEVFIRLKKATMLCSLFFLIEITGGFLSGSLAILSDAAHLLADLASFAIALLAARISNLPTDATMTFGWKRVEAIAALFSAFSLALVTAGLAVEALWRIYMYLMVLVLGRENSLEEVDGRTMTFIAILGVFVNVNLAYILAGSEGIFGHHSHGHHDHERCSSHDDDSHSHDHDHHHTSTDHSHSHHDHSDDDHDDHHSHDSSHAHSHSHSHSDDHSHEKHVHVHDEFHSHNVCDDGSHSHPNENDSLLVKNGGHYGSIEDDEKSVHQDHMDNLNLRAAYLHVLGDLALSIAVLISGVLIWNFPSCQIVDPLCTIFFSFIVFQSTLPIFKSSISILLNASPSHISPSDVKTAFLSIPNVVDAHDIHIWSISEGYLCLSAHVAMAWYEGVKGPLLQSTHQQINEMCHKKFGISHTTIQLLPEGFTACEIECCNETCSGSEKLHMSP